ncbi:MAG: hypothetical protein ACK55Z_09505, partial [bacterium]
GLARVEGFQAYDCSNSSNPVDMYSLLDPEPCPDVAMDHVVESVMSQYCGWQSRAGVVRYLKFREP